VIIVALGVDGSIRVGDLEKFFLLRLILFLFGLDDVYLGFGRRFESPSSRGPVQFKFINGR